MIQTAAVLANDPPVATARVITILLEVKSLILLTEEAIEIIRDASSRATEEPLVDIIL